ncbi:MAG: hypothetical protein NDJ90_00755 [Oligoflexia bacterium]|nr:hypothetical protein [Oligoflexia bacterium]
MLKRTIVIGLIFSAVCGAAYADVSVPFGIDAVNGVVQGKVSFLRRTTLVPMAVNPAVSIQTICDDGRPCVEPQVYWSMVVRTLNKSYELNEAFAMGSTKEPQEIEFFGATIRPGSQVAVEGRIETVSEDYAIVTDVKKVMCLDEALARAATLIERGFAGAQAGQKIAASLFRPRWACRSAAGSDGVVMHARVTAGIVPNESTQLPEEEFQLILFEKAPEEKNPRGSVQIRPVKAELLADAVVFTGVAAGPAGELEAVLRIEGLASSVTDLPGQLRIAERGNSFTETVFEMTCTRNLYF